MLDCERGAYFIKSERSRGIGFQSVKSGCDFLTEPSFCVAVQVLKIAFHELSFSNESNACSKSSPSGTRLASAIRYNRSMTSDVALILIC